jgi:RimJ/RimL family protein N-acetyltransferase
LIELVKGFEGDSGVALEPGDFKFTVEQERAFLERMAAADNAVMFVAEIDGRLVGNCGCTGGGNSGTQHVAGLGISVHRDWRGQGIGRQLMTAAVGWARENAVVRRLELNVFERNTVAIHLYQSFGFQIEGRHRGTHRKGGEFIDSLSMALWL